MIYKTLKESYDIDRQSGTAFWTKSIAKETKNVRIAFYNIDGVTSDEMSKGEINPGYKHVNMNRISYIKMDGRFTGKARLVAD